MPRGPGGGAGSAGELGTDALDPGLADMTILGTKDLGPAVAALVSSKSSSSSKLARSLAATSYARGGMGRRRQARRRGAGVPTRAADLAEEENASTCPPPFGPPPRRSSRLGRADPSTGTAAPQRGTAPLRTWSDDMPPYLFWFAIALSRAAAMAAGSLRSCKKRGGMRGRSEDCSIVKMEVGGPGKRVERRWG